MHREIKKVKKSQLPYEVSTSSIGEILKAKAAGGDKHAIKASRVFTERRSTNGQRNSYIRRSK